MKFTPIILFAAVVALVVVGLALNATRHTHEPPAETSIPAPPAELPPEKKPEPPVAPDEPIPVDVPPVAPPADPLRPSREATNSCAGGECDVPQRPYQAPSRRRLFPRLFRPAR